MARQLDGIALGAIGVGALFLYAGATNRSVLKGLQSVVAGGSPAAAPQNPFPGTTAPSAGTAPTSGGGGPVGGSSAGGTSWSKALLAAGGWPESAANVRSVNSWQAREVGGGQNNPLNTTQVMPGSTSFNSVGVQNYPSVAEGLAATVETLNNGSYGDIVMLLRSGQGLCGHTLQGLLTWSGKGYSSVC